MKTSVKRGYLVNGAAVVLAYALFVVLAATLGQDGSFNAFKPDDQCKLPGFTFNPGN